MWRCACRGCTPALVLQRMILILLPLLLLALVILDRLNLRGEVLGHVHLYLTRAGTALAAPLYAIDPALDALPCPPDGFNLSAAFQPQGGPRLWLWWTPQSPGSLPSNGGTFLEHCHASMLRHATPWLTLAIVNSSATRGPGAPYPLRRFPLPPYFDALPVNHQGDFGSFALLAEYGGMYLDTDVLVLHSLEPTLRLLERHQFVGFGGHSYDSGVHHGMMAARPGAEVLARTYHAALEVYAREGGCAGAACAHVGGLRWLSTLDAFSAEAKAFLHPGTTGSSSGAVAAAGAAAGPAAGAHAPRCAYARLPTRQYEPGMEEHQDLCLPRLSSVLVRAGWGGGSSSSDSARDAEATSFVASTMSAALAGVLRVVHLSPSKSGVGIGQDMEACPLLGFLWGVAMGRPDVALVQAVGREALGAWTQAAHDFTPLRRGR